MSEYKQKRGIVISFPFSVGKNGTIVNNLTYDSLQIPKYLLYWDRIECPVHTSEQQLSSFSFLMRGSKSTHKGSTYPELDYLEECGVLQRHNIDFKYFSGISDHERNLLIQDQAFQKHNANEPGLWSIAQSSTSPDFYNNSESLAAEVELYGMLPIPAKDVPLADILEFKTKRADELIELRMYLDELNQEIINSVDIPRTKSTTMLKLEKSLKDIDTTLDESKIKKLYGNLRHVINHESFGGVAFGATAASTAGFYFPDNHLIQATAAGVGLYFSIRPFQISSSEHSRQLCYLHSIKRELR